MKISPHVDKLVFQKWEKVLDPEVYANREDILRYIYQIAFHEAGHAVAKMFTGHEAAHILSVSIIPNAHNHGRLSSERNFSEANFGRDPEQRREEGTGRNLLFIFLAGRVAAFRAVKGIHRELILDWLGDEWYVDGSDLFRVNRISTLMIRKYMPQHRILQLAEKWTFEMFEIPQVWKTTNKVANALLQKGKLGYSQIDELCCEISNMAFSLPVWKNRLIGGARSRKWLKEEEKKAWKLYESGDLG